MYTAPLATGKVESLCVNGTKVESIHFKLYGPQGDNHRGLNRKLGKHDGDYLLTSALKKEDLVLNTRSWTGLSKEELAEVEEELGVAIPEGCLLENLNISSVPNFSKLPPTSRLVFPKRTDGQVTTQAILAAWEENGPCSIAGRRLAEHHGEPSLMSRFKTAAKGKRGLMGLVFSEGVVRVGDVVVVYPPLR